jgi:hypothetical protein
MNDAHIDDEVLSAYLDGELDAAGRARVAAALESDPGARVRLERMRSADEKLRREVPARTPSKVDPLAEYILRVDGETQARSRRRRIAAPLWALAAGIAGACLGFLIALSPSKQGSFELGYARHELGRVLESRASGEAANAEDQNRVLLTLRAADGRACRLFTSRDAHGEAEGLACRDAQGWRVLAWDATASSAGFRAAGASELLDAAMDKLDGAVLDPAAERELMSRGWRAE